MGIYDMKKRRYGGGKEMETDNKEKIDSIVYK